MMKTSSGLELRVRTCGRRPAANAAGLRLHFHRSTYLGFLDRVAPIAKSAAHLFDAAITIVYSSPTEFGGPIQLGGNLSRTPSCV